MQFGGQGNFELLAPATTRRAATQRPQSAGAKMSARARGPLKNRVTDLAAALNLAEALEAEFIHHDRQSFAVAVAEAMLVEAEQQGIPPPPRQTATSYPPVKREASKEGTAAMLSPTAPQAASPPPSAALSSAAPAPAAALQPLVEEVVLDELEALAEHQQAAEHPLMPLGNRVPSPRKRLKQAAKALAAREKRVSTAPVPAPLAPAALAAAAALPLAAPPPASLLAPLAPSLAASSHRSCSRSASLPMLRAAIAGNMPLAAGAAVEAPPDLKPGSTRRPGSGQPGRMPAEARLLEPLACLLEPLVAKVEASSSRKGTHSHSLLTLSLILSEVKLANSCAAGSGAEAKPSSMKAVVATASASRRVKSVVASLRAANTTNEREVAALELSQLSAMQNRAAILSAIVEEGGIAPLVELVDRGSLKSKEHAVGVLRRVADYTKVYRTAIAQAGGITPLVKLVSQSGGIASLVKQRQEAAVTLANLARGHTANQSAIAQAGAVPFLVKLLRSANDGDQVRLE